MLNHLKWNHPLMSNQMVDSSLAYINQVLDHLHLKSVLLKSIFQNPFLDKQFDLSRHFYKLQIIWSISQSRIRPYYANKPSYNSWSILGPYMGRKSIFHIVWIILIWIFFPIVVITDQSPLTVMKYTQGTSIFSKILRRRNESYSALIMVSFESYIRNMIQ